MFCEEIKIFNLLNLEPPPPPPQPQPITPKTAPQSKKIEVRDEVYGKVIVLSKSMLFRANPLKTCLLITIYTPQGLIEREALNNSSVAFK